MSKLEELIEQYCPDGVEWKILGEVCDIHKGVQFNKTDMKEVGTYPVINGGINPSGYAEVFNEGKNTITISQGGASAGYVNFLRNKFWLGAHCYAVIPYDTVLNKYLYHFIKMNEVTLQQCQYGAGIPALAKSTISSLEIPVPPLPVQEEIVRILDTFTELQAELQAELQKRKQQYNYYLDNLLNFNNISRGGQAEVRWMKMNEVFEIRNGYTPSKAKKEFWEGGTIPWFRMEDIRQNGRILSDSILHITPKGVKGKGLFKANSFILATTATIGEHALIIADSLANQRFTNLSIRKSLENELSVKYVYYYFFIIDEWCKANTNVSNFASVDMSKFYNLLIPIPSIAEQQRVVSILDRFDALTTDLTAGLPAEIEKRKQQYEYYRDKLLTFKRKGA